MQLVGETSFNTACLFIGMCMEGFACQFLVFVKCISLFLTWSVFSPLCVSHLCVSLNVIMIICAVISRVGPDVRIALSSTYNVVCKSVALSCLMRGLSSVDFSMHVVATQCTSPIIGKVKYAARMGDTHEPCGTPVSIRQSLSLLPSRHRVACQSWRKECTHLVIGSGMWCEQSVLSRCEWGIVSKKPVMSNVMMDALCL